MKDTTMLEQHMAYADDVQLIFRLTYVIARMQEDVWENRDRGEGSVTGTEYAIENLKALVEERYKCLPVGWHIKNPLLLLPDRKPQDNEKE